MASSGTQTFHPFGDDSGRGIMINVPNAVLSDARGGSQTVQDAPKDISQIPGLPVAIALQGTTYSRIGLPVGVGTPLHDQLLLLKGRGEIKLLLWPVPGAEKVQPYVAEEDLDRYNQDLHDFETASAKGRSSSGRQPSREG